MDVVFAGFWDLGKDTGNKLEDIDCFSVWMGDERVFAGAIGFVEEFL